MAKASQQRQFSALPFPRFEIIFERKAVANPTKKELAFRGLKEVTTHAPRAPTWKIPQSYISIGFCAWILTVEAGSFCICSVKVSSSRKWPKGSTFLANASIGGSKTIPCLLKPSQRPEKQERRLATSGFGIATHSAVSGRPRERDMAGNRGSA